MIVEPEYRLVVFDLDGTLANRNSDRLLPAASSFLMGLLSDPMRPQIAIATNQGGVGLRYWMEREGFGDPDRYPTQEDVERRLDAIVNQFPMGLRPRVYVCYAYRSHKGNWSPTPIDHAGDPQWSRSWRKPNAGMLLQAMEDAAVSEQETLFVGDQHTDLQAASNAGVGFRNAQTFFAVVPEGG